MSSHGLCLFLSPELFTQQPQQKWDDTQALLHSNMKQREGASVQARLPEEETHFRHSDLLQNLKLMTSGE